MSKRTIKSALWALATSTLILLSGALSIGHQLGPGTTGPLYMLLILIVAWRAGFRASLPVILSATLGLDFFFTEPRFTLRMASPNDVFAVVSFAAVALLVSHLSNSIRSHSEQVQREEEKQRALYELSRSAILIDWRSAVAEQLCTLIHERCKLSGVALWDDPQNIFACAGSAATAASSLQEAFRAAKSHDHPTEPARIRMLRFGVRPVGAIVFQGALDALMADAIATLVATHLERARAMKAEVSAESQAVSEKLRTAVLDGLAHAVKTPLTTIIVSSSGLAAIGPLTPLQKELSETIETEASYLAHLTDKLLRTARLESPDALVRKQTIDLHDLFATALEELRVDQEISRVQASFPSAPLPISVDPDFFRMALVQLLENALKYSPAGSKVDMHVANGSTDLSIAVHNTGSFIPHEEATLIFERFYRSPTTEHRAPGTGIGLSVARRAIEAHGGRVRVESDRAHGTTFVLTLPMQELPL